MVQHGNRSWKRLASVAALAVVSSSACMQAAPPLALPAGRDQGATDTTRARQADATPAANGRANATSATTSVAALATPAAQASAPTATALALRTVAARRGEIADELLLTGRVAGEGDTPLTFTVPGRITSVAVKAGQQVNQGAPLVQADTAGLEKDLKALRERVDGEALRLAQAQTQADLRRQSAVADAEDRLAKAQADLAKLQAGAPTADRAAAQGAVVSAQAALAKAQADQAKLQAGASATELKAAEQKVNAAQLAVRKAQADYDALQKVDPGVIRSAELEVANTKNALDVAQADLDRLTKGGDPLATRQAERNVTTAQAALRAAQNAEYKTDAARDAAVASAQAALDGAKDNLAKLKEPPTQPQIDAAKNKVDAARFAFNSAQDKLNKLRDGTPPLTLDAAKAALDSATAALDDAQAQWRALKQGATDDQLAAAQAAVDGAALSLQGAQARLDELNSHPTPAELQDAQARVAAAQRALALARNGDLSGEAAALQQSLETDRQQLAVMQAQLDASTLRAPFDGIVSLVQAQNGDTIDVGKTVVVVSKPGSAVVQAPVPQRAKDTPDVTAGQSATLQLDGGSVKLNGSVAKVEDSPTGPGRIATVQVDWNGTAPTFGTLAQVWVAVQDKANALLVPQAVVRASGDKRFVDILDGATVRSVEVTTGISNSTDVEILSGLSEGQNVLLNGAAVANVPQAQPTQPISPTPPPTPAPRPLLDEHFADNVRGWPDDPVGTAWLDDGGYHLATRQPGRFVAVRAPLPKPVQDVTISARFRKLGGPAGGGYGLIIGDQTTDGLDGVQQTGRFTVLEVGDKGEFGIWQRVDDRWVDIIPWTTAPSIQPGGAPNDLLVRVTGPRVELVVNGVSLASQSIDAVSQGGYVGIFVGGDGNDVLLEQLHVEGAASAAGS